MEHPLGKYLYKKGALYLLEKLEKLETARFTDLYDHEVYRTPSLLTLRLRELEELKLVERSLVAEPGKRGFIVYRLTKKGRKVLDMVRSLEEFLSQGL